MRGARIAVLASSPMAVHQALLFRQLSDDVTVLLHDQPAPGPEDAAHLAALGVPVVTGRVEGITALGDDRLAVNLGGDERLEAEAVVVGPRMVARGDLYEQLGGRLTDHPMGLFIEAGPMGRTPLDGVWAAGNVGNLSAMVTVASGEGLMAGAAINADLVQEEVRAAVAASALHEVP